MFTPVTTAHRSAYRQSPSTDTAVVIVHNDIVRATDDGLVSALELLDWSAAFDTLDHIVLLHVLSTQFGVTNHTCNNLHYYKAQAFLIPTINTMILCVLWWSSDYV